MTYIYREININNFHDYFYKYNREDNFSHEAREELFEYYTYKAKVNGEPYHLDVIGICCEWEEYDSLKELLDFYDKTLDELEDLTYVIKTSINSYLIREF